MNWDTAQRLPWGILILFGGGLSLAAAVKANGVAEFIGAQTVAFAGVPDLVIGAAIILIAVLLAMKVVGTIMKIVVLLLVGIGIYIWVS